METFPGAGGIAEGSAAGLPPPPQPGQPPAARSRSGRQGQEQEWARAGAGLAPRMRLDAALRRALAPALPPSPSRGAGPRGLPRVHSPGAAVGWGPVPGCASRRGGFPPGSPGCQPGSRPGPPWGERSQQAQGFGFKPVWPWGRKERVWRGLGWPGGVAKARWLRCAPSLPHGALCSIPAEPSRASLHDRDQSPLLHPGHLPGSGDPLPPPLPVSASGLASRHRHVLAQSPAPFPKPRPRDRFWVALHRCGFTSGPRRGLSWPRVTRCTQATSGTGLNPCTCGSLHTRGQGRQRRQGPVLVSGAVGTSPTGPVAEAVAARLLSPSPAPPTVGRCPSPRAPRCCMDCSSFKRRFY